MALSIAGDPLTRPPISSVKRRRFSSIGDGPMTWGKIFAAACAQLEASVAEQAAELCPVCAGLSESFAGGNCARLGIDTTKQRRNKASRVMMRRIVLLPTIDWRCKQPISGGKLVHPGAE